MTHNEYQQQMDYDKLKINELEQEKKLLVNHLDFIDEKLKLLKKSEYEKWQDYVIEYNKKTRKDLKALSEKHLCRKCHFIADIHYDNLCYYCYNGTTFDIKTPVEEEICETCGKDYDECETCECPNDAKCLVLCEQEKEKCGICDRNAYHKNDWHCSQGKKQ